MKILVTGASGFIGTHTVAECLRQGHEVMAFDRKQNCSMEGVVRFLGDIRDRHAVNEAVAGCDAGINLAGILGTSENVDNPFPAIETNIFGGINFFDACRKHDKSGVQITVGNWFMHNTYSITKRALEKFAAMYNKEHGTRIAVVRGLSVYGENQSHRPVRKAVPNFICRALRGEPLVIYGSGNSVQDQVYVKDLARVLVAAAVNPAVRYDKVYEAGTGVETTVNQIAEKINRIANNTSGIRHIAMRPGETDHAVIIGDPSTLQELEIGKLTGIDDGYAKTIAWYREYYPWHRD